MSIYRYADRCRLIAEEIREDLDGDEYEALFEIMSQYSYTDWLQWRREHEEECLKLLAAAPKARKKRLDRLQGEEPILMVFAACQAAEDAAAFLAATDQANFLVGLSYRRAAAEANRLRREMLRSYESYWPWGGNPSYADE